MVWTIAHRGASKRKLENSPAAFKEAIRMGADFFELDVRATKDKKIIVMHDETLERISNGKGRIKDLTLKEIKIFSLKNKEKIPTLEEVLKLIKKPGIKTKIIVEIKEEGMENELVKIVKKNLSKVILISNISKAVQRCKNLLPKVKTGTLIFERGLSIEQMINKALENKSEIVLPRYNEIKKILKILIREAHKNKLKVITWTVDKKRDIKKLKKSGIDGIASNYPERI